MLAGSLAIANKNVINNDITTKMVCLFYQKDELYIHY
jgi:hypothetical protein